MEHHWLKAVPLALAGCAITAACHFAGWNLAWIFFTPILERNPF